MAKFEIGDKVVVVEADSVYDTYKNGDTGVVEAYDVRPDTAGYVRREDGELMNVYWSEVELVEGEKGSTGAESLRNSILNIRSKREEMQKEILRLDEQEKEAVEKLKEQGFVLYEDNVSEESVATENKAVLYAEDIEEDTTNPENWKVGDLILCVDGEGWKNWIDEGEVGEMVKELTLGLCLKTKYGVYTFGSSYYKDFRFHSRPVK